MAAIQSLNANAPAATAANKRAGRQTLAALRALGRLPKKDDPAQTRQTASQMVSQLFFAPMLAEMRKLPFGQKFANGGRMEDAFGEQFDMKIADAVAADASGLTAKLEKYLQPKGNHQTQGMSDVYA